MSGYLAYVLVVILKVGLRRRRDSARERTRRRTRAMCLRAQDWCVVCAASYVLNFYLLLVSVLDYRERGNGQAAAAASARKTD